MAIDFQASSDDSFVTCGKGHVYFWSYQNEALSRKSGILNAQEKPKFYTCVLFAADGVLLAGDTNGSISIWNKGTLHDFLTNCFSNVVGDLIQAP